MKKAIAMHCTQEQFKQIESKIKHLEITCIDDFKKFCYLVNNGGDIENCITNVTKKGKSTFVREIHETWNEKVFLEACGIETEPEYVITDEALQWIYKIGNSETKEFVRNNFPDALKEDIVELEVGKWYKHGYGGLWCIDSEPDDNGNRYVYGFTSNGDYFAIDKRHTHRLEREATPEEVTEALTKEAVKRGFKEGTLVKCMTTGEPKELKVDLSLIASPVEVRKYVLDFGKRVDIFRDGVWAEIIPTITKEDAEKELGKKIV